MTTKIKESLLYIDLYTNQLFVKSKLKHYSWSTIYWIEDEIKSRFGKLKIVTFFFIINMKSTKIKPKKKYKRHYSYIRNIVELLTPPLFKIIADFFAK